MWAIILLLLALAIWLLAGRAQRASGLPRGVVVYTDTGGWDRNEQPLYSAHLGLNGKPDYLVRQGGTVVPVEVKSMAAPPAGPHAGHVFQLAAYCALVAETTGRRPPFGLLRYADQTLRVDYTPALERELHALLREMRAARTAADVGRSHAVPARCRACGFAAVCGQALE
jgi:CRISPR-associated exonuclease Cas4